MKNYFLVLIAQAITLLIGIIKIIFIPYILGVDSFGYWQMYLLYVGYLGVLSLGFNDGIIIKYGSFTMENLPKGRLKGSLLLFLAMQMFFIILLLIITTFESNDIKQTVFLFVIGNILLTGITGITIGLLQVTNNFKKYSLVLTIDKVISIIIYGCLFYFNIANFTTIIIVDIVSKVISCIFSIYFCKEVFFGGKAELKGGIIEFKDNIQIGIKIMLSNLMGMLMIGYALFIIERALDIKQFSIIAFGISTTNIIILFASSLGVLIYPFISRRNFNENQKLHIVIKEGITIILFVLLIGFFPIKYIIEKFLSDYSQVLTILPILFVYVIYESKINIIINPYFKSLRFESLIFKFNIIFLIPSLLLTTFILSVSSSVLFLFISICINIIIKYILMEKVIFETFGNKRDYSMIIDFVIIFGFLIFSNQEDSLFAMLGYILLLISFIFIKKRKIIDFYRYVVSKS